MIIALDNQVAIAIEKAQPKVIDLGVISAKSS